MKLCPACGRENKDRAKFCTGCGASLAPREGPGGAGGGGGDDGPPSGASPAVSGGASGSGASPAVASGAPGAFGPTLLPDEETGARAAAGADGGGAPAAGGARPPAGMPTGPRRSPPPTGRAGAPAVVGGPAAAPASTAPPPGSGVARPLEATLPAPMPAIQPEAADEEEGSDLKRTLAFDGPPPSPPPRPATAAAKAASGPPATAKAGAPDLGSQRTMAIDPATLEAPPRKGTGPGAAAPHAPGAAPVTTPPPGANKAGAGAAAAPGRTDEDAPARLIAPSKGLGIKLRTAAPPETTPQPGSQSTIPTSPPGAPGGAGAPAPGGAAGADTIDCPRCGSKVPVGFAFCGNCGANVRDAGTSARIGLPPGGAAAAAVAAAVAPTPIALAAPAGLVLLTPDGRDMRRIELRAGENVVGRTGGEVVLGENIFLSPRHAILTRTPEGLTVRDLQSLNGVYRRIREEVELSPGDLLCIGQQFFRFEPWAAPAPRPHADGTVRHGAPIPAIGARLIVVGFGGEDLDLIILRNEETVIGRANGDIIFASDSFISRSHARLAARNGRYTIADLGSSNGTYLRIRGQADLDDGDILLMGDQLFRVDLGS